MSPTANMTGQRQRLLDNRTHGDISTNPGPLDDILGQVTDLLTQVNDILGR